MEEEAEPEDQSLPPLHRECAQPDPSLANLQHLLSQGCDPNQICCQGRTPLHTLLQADHTPATPLLPLVDTLLAAGASLALLDKTGSSALTSLAAQLAAGRIAETVAICERMLAGPACDVNHMDAADRTLLSYSVAYLDQTADLTRVLVNHGARVWPAPAPPPPVNVSDLTRDREQSAFTWFLRSAIQASSLAESTLTCLSHEMGRDPGRMRGHVMRVMLSEGKHPRVLGPLYRQLKLAMAPFWSEPQQLRYLAWNSIRKSMGPKRLSSGSRQLGLPSPLRRYLTLHSPRMSKESG